MNNALISKVNTTDIDFVFELENINFTYDSYSIDTLKKYIIDKNTLFLKINIDNSFVGYCIVLLIKPDAELLKICIKDQYRNKGLAKFLLDYVINYLKKMNYNNIFLEVRSNNMKAIKLYESTNFKEYNRRINYYKDPNCDAIMFKKIIV